MRPKPPKPPRPRKPRKPSLTTKVLRGISSATFLFAGTTNVPASDRANVGAALEWVAEMIEYRRWQLQRRREVATKERKEG